MGFLSDAEWLCLNDLILSVNSIDDDREFRRVVLKRLRFLVPYESAIFFLSDLSKDLASSPEEWRTRAIIDPVGIDVPDRALTSYLEDYAAQDYMATNKKDQRGGVFRETEFLDEGDLGSAYLDEYLEGRYVVDALFFNGDGFLGSFNLNRTKEMGDFSDREVQILETLYPHVLNRLSKWRLKADRSSAEVLFSHDFGISPRELEVARCVANGLDNAAISDELCISLSTVKKHLESVFRKTCVANRFELMALLQGYAKR